MENYLNLKGLNKKKIKSLIDEDYKRWKQKVEYEEDEDGCILIEEYYNSNNPKILNDILEQYDEDTRKDNKTMLKIYKNVELREQRQALIEKIREDYIIEEYKKADAELQEKIFDDIVYRIFNSKYKLGRENKRFGFKVNPNKLYNNKELIECFNKYKNTNYYISKEVKEIDHDKVKSFDCLKIEYNSLYNYNFDKEVYLHKNYYNLIKTAKNFYYKCIYVDKTEIKHNSIYALDEQCNFKILNKIKTDKEPLVKSLLGLSPEVEIAMAKQMQREGKNSVIYQAECEKRILDLKLKKQEYILSNVSEIVNYIDSCMNKAEEVKKDNQSKKVELSEEDFKELYIELLRRTFKNINVTKLRNNTGDNMGHNFTKYVNTSISRNLKNHKNRKMIEGLQRCQSKGQDCYIDNSNVLNYDVLQLCLWQSLEEDFEKDNREYDINDYKLEECLKACKITKTQLKMLNDIDIIIRDNPRALNEWCYNYGQNKVPRIKWTYFANKFKIGESKIRQMVGRIYTSIKKSKDKK